ncbi:hypothetical protein ACJX0J_031899, partial [Zea mays]
SMFFYIKMLNIFITGLQCTLRNLFLFIQIYDNFYILKNVENANKKEIFTDISYDLYYKRSNKIITILLILIPCIHEGIPCVPGYSFFSLGFRTTAVGYSAFCGLLLSYLVHLCRELEGTTCSVDVYFGAGFGNLRERVWVDDEKEMVFHHILFARAVPSPE